MPNRRIHLALYQEMALQCLRKSIVIKVAHIFSLFKFYPCMIAVPYQGALNTLVVVMILRLIVKEKFQIYLCFSITVLTLGDDSIALKRGFSIEHCIIHLLW